MLDQKHFREATIIFEHWVFIFSKNVHTSLTNTYVGVCIKNIC